MRFKLFSIYVFLFTFCVFAFGSGSGGVAPKLEFKYYQAGQGDANSKTFITNTETTCKLTVKVGYADSQPANAYKLKRCGWKVAAEILLPGLSDEEKKHTFTFKGTGTQSVTPVARARRSPILGMAPFLNTGVRLEI